MINQVEIISQASHSDFRIEDFAEVTGTTSHERLGMIERHHYKTLWTYAVNCILAVVLITDHFLFDYQSSALVASDVASGALIILFEAFSFKPRLALLRWGVPAVGFWLLMAPLIFWSPTPAVYIIDTLIACFLMAFSVLVPGLPGSAGLDLPGPDKPPGWTYNPSSWIRRWLGIALALVGFLISRYLAAHQLGYIDHAWDPFFGNGTDEVTGSAVSRSFPISDAGFGAVAYMMETLTGFMGDRARWRTAPFIAVMFALLVLPLGVTSIVLVITQPVVVGAWCGLCLISAAALLASVPLAVHEAIAVGQFLLAAKQQKKSFWQVFWMGGSVSGIGMGTDGRDPDRFHFTLAQRWIASVQGVTVPWSVVVQLALGVWLMARPDILPFDKFTADCDHLLGAMVVTVAAVATAEVTRVARFANVILGAALLLVAVIAAGHFNIFNLSLSHVNVFHLSHESVLVLLSDCLCGLTLIFASIPRGTIAERYAGWDRWVF